ncbi:MAG TPA: phenylacetate--CoA ligase [Chloroflexi bacterium]|nr:phenylacetate--CoA ligase [Chloroflexota bacterium]
MSKNERLKEIIKHACQNAPAVKQMMQAAGLGPADIESLEDLPRLPVTTKDELAKQQQENPPFGGWLAAPVKSLRRIFISPGPLFDPQGANEVIDAARGEAFTAVGIGAEDIVLNTFMYHLVPAGILLDNGLAAVGATVVPTGPGNTEYQAKIAVALAATGYVGAPSFLKIILDKMAEMGIPKEAVPIKKALFSAEPYPQSLRSVFEGEYGMSTGQAYATADLGVIAYEQPGEAGLRISSDLIVEVVDPESGQPVPPGQVGHVVVTTFNKTYPLIRLGTGDLSAFGDESRTHIKGWMGRVGDAIKVRGMFLHPLQLMGAIASVEGTGKAQAIVRRPDARDTVALKIEFSAPGADQTAVVEQIKNVVRTAVRLKIDAVELLSPNTLPANARPIEDERSWD